MLGCGVGMGIRDLLNTRKIGKKRVRKLCFRGRQVGAFSVFSPGYTGGPFIFRRFSRFLRKIVRLRGWCNITPVWLSKMNTYDLNWGWAYSLILSITNSYI